MSDISLATIERQMLKHWEIKQKILRLEEEAEMLKDDITNGLEKRELSSHQVVLNEDFSVKVSIKPSQKKKFNKEKFARDLGVSEAEAGSKDLLINLTEQNKLTLKKFLEYFFREPSINYRISRIKNKTTKSKKDKL